MSIKEYLKKTLGEAYTDEVDAEVGKQLGADYVPKHTYAEQSQKLKSAEAQNGEVNKQLEELKKTAGDNSALQKQIDDFKNDNQKLKDDNDKALQSVRFDYALTAALKAQGAKSVKAVRGFLDVDKLTLDGENIIGLAEQLDGVKKSDAYLFDEKPTSPGGNPPPPHPDKPARPVGQIFL